MEETENHQKVPKNEVNKILEELSMILLSKPKKINNISEAVWLPEATLSQIIKQKGVHFNTMGFTKKSVTYLNAYETLYLIEKGCLDLYFKEKVVGIKAAYCLILRSETDFENYQVYSTLKRQGYVVLKSCNNANILENNNCSHVLWDCGFIYKKLQIVNSVSYHLFMNSYNNSFTRCHKCDAEAWKIDFNIYKSSRNFKKSLPGTPDFQVVCKKPSDLIFNCDNIFELIKSSLEEVTCLNENKKNKNKELKTDKNFKTSNNLDDVNIKIAVSDNGMVTFLTLNPVVKF
ncbi:hypothetical protein HK099_004699 [Clydaea vesicula]|uniref:tRNA-splicing endonuclease subunit Sen54 N-terminal domain-containing protein n=1 Tax=Clydaea vesicula TaxID=447962 RepID=A0AAD5UAJ0_9FUNG|nr:hypothetical protein HK099_004699 [Clydaea vesicula]